MQVGGEAGEREAGDRVCALLPLPAQSRGCLRCRPATAGPRCCPQLCLRLRPYDQGVRHTCCCWTNCACSAGLAANSAWSWAGVATIPGRMTAPCCWGNCIVAKNGKEMQVCTFEKRSGDALIPSECYDDQGSAVSAQCSACSPWNAVAQRAVRRDVFFGFPMEPAGCVEVALKAYEAPPVLECQVRAAATRHHPPPPAACRCKTIPPTALAALAVGTLWWARGCPQNPPSVATWDESGQTITGGLKIHAASPTVYT